MVFKKSLFLIHIYTALFISQAFCKIYEPCELAQELVQNHRFSKTDLADWICLIKHESNFDTSAIGRLNADGSLDHGLFQISDIFWCNHGQVDGACGVNCSDLENDDIKDDAICARRIFRITKHRTGNGFDAWVAWKQHCSNGNVMPYLSNCTFLQ